MPQDVLTTERLRLRPRTMADLDACVAMDLDPEVHRFIYGDSPPDRRSTGRSCARASHRAGPPRAASGWSSKARAGLSRLVRPVPARACSGPIEIGYRYVRSAWGQGIATEAGHAVLDHGFRRLGFDPIVGVTHPANRASQRVLEKLGPSARRCVPLRTAAELLRAEARGVSCRRRGREGALIAGLAGSSAGKP